jgi:acetylornithine deacetylase/succinyl-diaminopimelate desuccinylase family protein
VFRVSESVSLPADVVARVTEAIDASRDEVVALLQDLIRIPSTNPKLSDEAPGGEAAVQDRLAPAMHAAGCELDRWDALPGRPNQVGTVRGTGGGRSLAINGHIDVVPVGDASDWTHGPWSGKLVDGAVWGRGASDMKGGVAAMVHAATILRRLGFGLNGDLYLEAVIDEETGGPGTRASIERGYRPDFALIAEPTPDRTIQPVEGGLEWLRVTIVGKSGHSAVRYRSVHAGGRGEAVNALEKGMKVLAAVNDLERAWSVRKVHPLLPFGITTINPGVMAAGSGGGKDGLPNVMTAVSTMPDYCSLELSLKYLPSEKTAEVRAEFEEFIHRVAQTDEWLRQHPPTIEWGLRGVSFPPADTLPDHPAVKALSACVESVLGPVSLYGCVGVTDMAWFGEAGIPSAIYGPGSWSGIHGVDEFIEIDRLIDGTKVFALMMLAWCGYE